MRQVYAPVVEKPITSVAIVTGDKFVNIPAEFVGWGAKNTRPQHVRAPPEAMAQVACPAA